MLLIGSLITAIVIIFFISMADKMLADGKKKKKSLSARLKPVIIGAVVGAITYFSPLLEETMWMSIGFLAIMLGLYVYLVYWFIQEGGYVKELIVFVVIALLFFWPTKAAAVDVATIFENGFLISFTFIIPILAFFLSVGIMVANYFYFLYVEIDKVYKGDDEDASYKKEAKKGFRKALCIGVCCVTGLALVATFATGTNNYYNQSAYAADSDAEIGSVPSDVFEGAHFYNADLQNDGNEQNDFNFGPKPPHNQAREEFMNRLSEDPFLVANTAMALDYTQGTDFLGQILYVGYREKNNVLTQVDAATRVLAADEDLFNRTSEAVKGFLKSGKAKVKSKNVYAEVFASPYTVDGIPATVVYVSEMGQEDVLEFTFEFKEGTKTKTNTDFHINCGFQWSNGVVEATGASPIKSLSRPGNGSKPRPGGTGDNPKKPGTGDSPNKPSYSKDPGKAPTNDTEKNDDPGPGQDTNNPKDPQHSKLDTPDSSTSGSYTDYKNHVQELKDTNTNQKTGEDSNTPSTNKPSTNTKVDNSGGPGKTPQKPKPPETKEDPAGDEMDAPK